MTIRNKTITAEHLFSGDKVIWMMLFFLCIISIIEVYSASSNMTYHQEAFWDPIVKHSILLAGSVTVTWFIHRIHCRFFGWWAVVGPVLSIILLIAVYFFGKVNSTSRWIDIFGLSFQPSEMAKGSLIVAVAWILSVMRDENGATKEAFYWVLCITGIICGLIAPENLSTAVLTFAVVLMMMWIGRIPWKYFGKLLGIIAIISAVGYGVLRFTPEPTLNAIKDVPALGRVSIWANRVRTHTPIPDDPYQYDLSANPQITQSYIAIATCNVIGRFPGNSRVKDFLPQAYSDFIFAIIIEEMGLAVGFIVLSFYLILLYRSARIAKKCKKCFPAYMMLGLSLLIVTQALINMAVAVHLLPVTGQPLPLVSKGGSSILVNCAYIGMMLSISRTALKVNDTPQTENSSAES